MLVSYSDQKTIILQWATVILLGLLAFCGWLQSQTTGYHAVKKPAQTEISGTYG